MVPVDLRTGSVGVAACITLDAALNTCAPKPPDFESLEDTLLGQLCARCCHTAIVPIFQVLSRRRTTDLVFLIQSRTTDLYGERRRDCRQVWP